jgi:cell division protein FtsI (penicillin-binding protein 3)
MENKSKNFIFHENNYEFHYKKKETNIDIRFNRVAFIFFVFFIISVIYSIHLLHLGSRKDNQINKNQL